MKSNSFRAIASLSDSFLLQNEVGHQVRYRSNRSKRGLYDGKDVGFGNKVSFSEKKTRRKFKPNVFKKRVFSEILNKMICFNLTASALRSIDKMGGLDNYLLTSKHVQGGQGLKVKKNILNRLRNLRRLRKKGIIKHNIWNEIDFSDADEAKKMSSVERLS